MADYDLGTAKGKLVLDSSGVTKGVAEADASIQGLDDSARRSTGGMQLLEKSMIAVGVAGVAAFAYAINKAADFEQSMSGIKAVSGATADQMDKLRKKALKLGADTVFSAGDASLAMEELAKSGLKVDDILNGAADATVALAAAGQIDLPQAATIAANAMNQFGLAASELPHVADLIAGAANASSIDVSDFGLAMAQAGAVANLTGLSFDDMALAITAMGNAGIKGSDAGTSLKTFLTGLQPVTDKQKKLFDDLGLSIEGNATSMNKLGNSFFTAQGQVKPMSEIAGTLATALAGMSEQQKIATLETLFGTDAIRAAAIIADTGAAGFDTLAASMGNVTAADVAATRLDNFKGSMEQLKGSVETAAINIGTIFLPALRDVADFATVWVNKFSAMDEGTQKFIAFAALGATTAAGLLGAIGLFAHAAAPAIGGIGSITSGVSSLGGALVTALGPWGLIIIAVAAVAAALVYAYFHFQRVRDVIDTVGRAIRDFAMTVVEWFTKNVLPALKTFAAFFMDTIVPALRHFLDVAMTVINAVVDFFTNTLVPGIATAWQAIMDVIGPFATWFNDNVVSTVNAAIELLIAIFGRVEQFVRTFIVPQLEFLFNLLAPIISAVFDVIGKTIGFALDIIKGIIGVFINFVQKAWALFGDNILSAIMVVFDFIKNFIELILGVVRGIMQFFTGLITGDWGKAWEGIKTIFTSVWDFIKGFVSNALDTIKLVIETAIDAIKLILSTAWDIIKTAAGLAWEGIKLLITAPMELIGGILQGIWDAITGAASTAWDWIKTLAGLAWDSLANLITVPIDIAKATLQTIWDGIKSAAETAWNAVKNVIEPIINKIVAIIQKIIDIANDAIDAVKSIPKKIGGFLPSTSGNDVPFVPFFARGAIVTQQTLGWIAEKGPEVIIPLDDPARAAYLMAASGLSAMFGDSLPPSQPSTFSIAAGQSPPSPTLQEIPQSFEGVHIDEANFYDSAGIDTLLQQADFAIQGAKL